MKKNFLRFGLFFLAAFSSLLTPLGSQAATGMVAVRVSAEIAGKSFPLNAAQLTILDKELDLAAVDILAKRKARETKNEEQAYHLYRFIYLVRAVEDSRRTGVRQIRHGILTKRTNHNGEVLIRYLKPGNYYLAAYRKRGELAVVWFVPFSISAGRVTELVLDNSNAFEIYHPSLYR